MLSSHQLDDALAFQEIMDTTGRNSIGSNGLEGNKLSVNQGGSIENLVQDPWKLMQRVIKKLVILEERNKGPIVNTKLEREIFAARAATRSGDFDRLLKVAREGAILPFDYFVKKMDLSDKEPETT